MMMKKFMLIQRKPPNLYKIDIYSIGYIFLVYFYKAMKIKFSKANEFLSYQLKCLTIRMTNINPSKQINIKQCMLYLNAEIQSIF